MSAKLNRKERRTMESMQRKAKGAEDQSEEASATDALGDDGWEDLKRLYLECQALSVQPARILPLLKDKEALEKVSDIRTLLDKSKVLNKDVNEFKQRLNAIYAKHANRSGSSSDPDDLMTCLAIGEEYQNWIHEYQDVVQPLIQDILSHFDTSGEFVKSVEGEFIPADNK